MKSRYSSKEVESLTVEIYQKYISHCHACATCRQCQYGVTDISCTVMFTLDYLNKKGKLKL